MNNKYDINLKPTLSGSLKFQLEVISTWIVARQSSSIEPEKLVLDARPCQYPREEWWSGVITLVSRIDNLCFMPTLYTTNEGDRSTREMGMIKTTTYLMELILAWALALWAIAETIQTSPSIRLCVRSTKSAKDFRSSTKWEIIIISQSYKSITRYQTRCYCAPKFTINFFERTDA